MAAFSRRGGTLFRALHQLKCRVVAHSISWRCRFSAVHQLNYPCQSVQQRSKQPQQTTSTNKQAQPQAQPQPTSNNPTFSQSHNPTIPQPHHPHNPDNSPQHPHPTTTRLRQVGDPYFHACCASKAEFRAQSGGVARRRREREMPPWWRHEQRSIRMAIATVMHHSFGPVHTESGAHGDRTRPTLPGGRRGRRRAGVAATLSG